jgi:hypothetical protein
MKIVVRFRRTWERTGGMRATSDLPMNAVAKQR